MSKQEREYGDFLDDILAYAEKAQRFVVGITQAEFVINDEKIFAVTYALEVIGEAANRLPRSLTDRYPEVPWAKVIGMRNHLIHGYAVLDVSIIWATVQEDLPPLRQQIARILVDLEQTFEPLMPSTLLAQIAPQRSTQYTALANDLAVQELQLSSLGQQITTIDPLTLGGQTYLKFDLPTEPDEAQARELGMLAMTRAFFVYYERIGDLSGPFLRPLETHFQPALPPDLIMTRRYRGKTNELFTHFLCNIARFSSAFADQPWQNLRLFDPLAGGGTTLFTALVFGANHVAGVEQSVEDVKSTAAFLRDYMREERIACQVKEERFKKLGLRWVFTLGKTPAQQCTLVSGDTAQSSALLPGFKPQLIVADLPYGIQHQGTLTNLLTTALPVWAKMLVRGGALVLAWDATRFTRAEMMALVETAAPLKVLNEPPYHTLAHRVDRVIKQRDVLVARPSKDL